MMGVPSGLVLLLSLQIFTESLSVTDVNPTNPPVPSTAGNSTGVEGQIRLANRGKSSCSGRVEIFHSGQWGTVCDDNWDLNDAQVVCRQVDCGTALSAPLNAAYGAGSGPILLDDVNCYGNELSITDCRHRGLGVSNCQHIEDASVVCENVNPTNPPVPPTTPGTTPPPPPPQTSTTNQVDITTTTTAGNSTGVEGQIRLANRGKSSCSGRVEIFHNGQWGTVCDDNWDLNDAQVVCRQVDCGTALSAPLNAAYGAGSGPILLDDVNCYGNELSITDCRHRGLGVSNCQHIEDASVVCENVNPTNPPVSPTTPGTTPPQTSTTNQVDITTTTTAGNSTGVEGQIRLANARNSSCSGRVEIFHSGQWGTVCDDTWGLLNAHVVCRQLGCGRVLSAPLNAHFGQGTGPIWLDDVMCAGNESKLTECSHRGFGSHNCNHQEDAGVVCEAGSPVRLVNSDNRCSGRVELYHNGQWGTVCDDNWDLNDAQVVCRQLGCGIARSALPNAAYGAGSGPIWLDDVDCYDNESSITDCRHRGLGVNNCQHIEDASVVCENVNPTNPPVPPTTPGTTPPPPPPQTSTTNQVDITTTTTAGNSTGVEGQIRLANARNSSCSGRVEIFHHGQWGTVCDDTWSLLNAHVVCRQLGCGRVLSAPLNAHFGQGAGPIWLDDVMCAGNESKLTECSHRGFGSHNCSHQEDAGVVCEAGSPVRLVNSDNRCSGRVELYHNGQWGTVCDNNWDLNDAQVVCRQLGCGIARSALPNAAYGAGSGPIWLDDVHCYGNESLITDCRHQGLGVNNCQHIEDASVVCEIQHSIQPLQPPRLICGRDKLQVGLDVDGLIDHGFDPFSGELTAGNCAQFRVRGYVVWYEVEARAGACGNTLRTNSTHAIYSNSLFIHPVNNAVFRPAMRIPFSCVYALDTDASLKVVGPFQLADGILGSGPKAKATMSLFRSSNYTDTYPSGQIPLPFGSPLYVGVSVEEVDSSFVVVLEDCYATNSSNPDDPMRYNLIKNKCPADRRQVSVTESGLSLHARFTALLFLSPWEDTFLHCSLSLCDQRSFFCVPPCTSRRSRSVSTSEPLTPLTIGPIIWVK